MSGSFTSVDLGQVGQGQNGFVIQGAEAYDGAGYSVASAGDVNGDGFVDLIIGARDADAAGNAKNDAGEAYVVFGRAAGFRGPIDLAAVARGRGGFVIQGEDAYDLAGVSVASAGDLNGDGFDDLIVGAFLADGADNAEFDAGAAYVVLGKAGGFGATVDLAAVALGEGGFVIQGEDAYDQAGFTVASAGDLNGDGFDDLVVGASGADGVSNAEYSAGAAYVVFGQAGSRDTPIDLAAVALGQGGFVIRGEDAGDYAGSAVASAGDVNGDGFDDLIVGAFRADAAGNAKDGAGAAYIVFGRAASFGAAIDLTAVARNEGGFVIQGEDAYDAAGFSVASAGDFNGDGFGDLIIGADRADAAGNVKSGAGGAYVVFGQSAGFGAAIDLSLVAQGAGGFVIEGEDAYDSAGISVAAAGDVNGDGFDDLIVGAFTAGGVDNLKFNAGAAYVVFGKAGGFGAAVDLAEVAQGQGGFVIQGEDEGDYAGRSVAAAGDLNGDGFDDLIVGAGGADGTGNSEGNAGAAYVLFGTNFGKTIRGTGEADTLLGTAGRDTILGDGGNDSIAGAAGNDLLVGGTGNDALSGVDGSDTVNGDEGNDTLIGGAGRDSLIGGNGTDLLRGGANDDTLNGGSGDDRLVGGRGDDRLIGGNGSDLFVFTSPNDGVDIIVNFVVADDQILVSAAGFDGLLIPGLLGPGNFAANPEGVATGGAPGFVVPQFVYDTDSGALFWDRDGTGVAAAVQIATLAGAATLTAADFTVVA